MVTTNVSTETPQAIEPLAPLVTVNHRSTNSALWDALTTAFDDAMAERSGLSEAAFKVPGFSGRKFRRFLNNLLSQVHDPRYLEIGLFRGASICSAIYRNELTALGVDNWSEYGGREDLFYENYDKFKHAGARVQILQQDFRTIPYTDHGPFNILFYDGPHSLKDQYDGVAIPLPALDNEAILIVDDWNWVRVRKGTLEALRDNDVVIEHSIEIRTSFKNEHLPVHHGQASDWHNGAFLAILKKR